MQLKDRPAAARRHVSSRPGSIAASVTTNPSIVAMSGAIIPAPFAMPQMVTVRPSSRICVDAGFGAVSVVMIAAAASAQPSSRRSRTAAGMPARILSMGSGTPITPVELTSTSSGAMSSSPATSRAVCRASANPRSPVQAFAFLLLMIMAWAVWSARCSRLTWIGAACTWLVVNTPAAAAGLLDAMRARSLSSGLRPQATPDARNPSGRIQLPSVIFKADPLKRMPV